MKNRALILCIAFVFSNLGWAKPKKTYALNPNPSPTVKIEKLAPPVEKPTGGGGAADMLQQTKIPDEITDRKGPEVKLFSSCTDASGQNYGQDDPGYKQCVEQKSAGVKGNSNKTGLGTVIKTP